MHIRQTLITTPVPERQSLVIDAKLVQDGGVEIVNGHRLVEVFKIQISKAGCGQQHGCDYCNEL